MSRMPELIRKKRDGRELTPCEIETFVSQVVNQSAQESQIGAMLMAMYIRGLSDSETISLTSAMVRSGETLQWDSEWADLLVDKHSTGGVGDKVSLILAPALAACGLKVPMVSGRGLEFTGGTLDKLESIPGFRVQLDKKEMRNALHNAGCFIAGATQSIAPADKIIYRIRDVTATVNSMPLVTASIVSKKVAAGPKALVMDIKVGKGAFFTEIEQARQLAKTIITVSGGLGLPARAVITRMDSPLGLTVGNALEVAEAVECLRGGGPADVLEVTTTLGGVIMEMKGLAKNLEEGKAMITSVLKSGKALQHFEKMLVCQGVMKTVAFELCNGEMWNMLPSKPKIITKLVASQTGIIVDIDGIEVAKACWHLGAGRSYAEQPIDLRVGVKLLATVGDSISSGQPWIEVHHIEERLDPNIRQQLERAVVINNNAKKNTRSSLIVEIL